MFLHHNKYKPEPDNLKVQEMLKLENVMSQALFTKTMTSSDGCRLISPYGKAL